MNKTSRIKWAGGRQDQVPRLEHCMKRGKRAWSIGILIVNRIVSGLSNKGLRCSVQLHLLKGRIVSRFPSCLSWAQQLLSSYLYYFTLDPCSQRGAIAIWITMISTLRKLWIWQIKNLQNKKIIESVRNSEWEKNRQQQKSNAQKRREGSFGEGDIRTCIQKLGSGKKQKCWYKNQEQHCHILCEKDLQGQCRLF